MYVNVINIFTIYKYTFNKGTRKNIYNNKKKVKYNKLIPKFII